MSSSAAASQAKIPDKHKNPLLPCWEKISCAYTSQSKRPPEEVQVPNFTSKDEFYKYLEKSKPTQLMVLNFTTTWCEPCQKAETPFKYLMKDYGDVKFAKVDVDHLMEIANQMKVKVIPTFVLVKVKKIPKYQVKEEAGKKKVPKDQVKAEACEKKVEDQVKADGRGQGDREIKSEDPVLQKRYKMVDLGKVEGYAEMGNTLIKKIEEQRHLAQP